MAPDDTIGNADMPPLWNLKAHAGYALHWDGMNTNIRDIVLSSAIGDGSTKDSIDLAGLKRVEDFLLALPPPKYPFAIDAAKAEKGRPIYEQKCAECHAFGGAGRARSSASMRSAPTASGTASGLTRPPAATTPSPRDTPGSSMASRAPTARTAATFRSRSTASGSAARSCTTARCPTLRDLLKAPGARPKQFWRGSDRYDPHGVGFDTVSQEARKVGTFFDTSVVGNGNGGHTYGTDLPDDQKDAIVEYMKTL